MRIRPVAIPPIVLAVALMAPGACGGGSKSDTSKFDGTDKDVAKAVYDFRDAVTKRDEGKICDQYFTAALRDKVAAAGKTAKRGSTCSDALKDSIQDIDATDITVQTVSVEGTKATVTIKTKVQKGDDPVDTLKLENIRGWRLAELP
jgi:hypothetical protein